MTAHNQPTQKLRDSIGFRLSPSESEPQVVNVNLHIKSVKNTPDTEVNYVTKED